MKNIFKKLTTKKRIKKAPEVSHTKGYYRFSKDFPSVTDAEGYRDNETIINSPATKAAKKRGLAILFVCVAVLSFIVSSFMFALSSQPIAEKGKESDSESTVSDSVRIRKTVYLTGEIFSSENINTVTGQIIADGADSVIIEFKDADGYFYFNPTFDVPTEALSKAADNTAGIVRRFTDAGITVYGAISCFADDIYARNHQDYALNVTSSEEDGAETASLWYNRNGDGHAWLSPYSDDNAYYLSQIVNDVLRTGAKGIIFENTVLPDFGEESVNIPGQSGSADSHAKKAADRLLVINNGIFCETGVVFGGGRISETGENTAFTDMLSSGCDYIIPDFTTEQPNTSKLIDTAAGLISENEANIKIIPQFDVSAVTDDTASSLASKNINSFIIYDKNFKYN